MPIWVFGEENKLMKYSVEYKNGKFVEVLEVNGYEATKTWQREDDGEISGLCSHDLDFSEQFQNVLDTDALERIYDMFDSNMLVSDMEDFIMYN